MINRVLIRIRVAQIVYAYFQNDDSNVKNAENNLVFSLEKSYELYFYLLSLLVEVTSIYQKRIALRKNRLLPSKEDINPDLKFAENRFVSLISKSQQFIEFVEEHDLSWENHENYLKNLLERILQSQIYKDYISNPVNDFNSDREFWRKIFKQIICEDEELDELLEDQSLYWNDDVEIVQSFVLKTIKKTNPELAEDELFLPIFKDQDDLSYAKKLLTTTLRNQVELREIIDKHTQNWESERVALMDMVIMQIAVTELLTFPSIPVNVTLNEYIDIVKAYSTNKSAGFINGILDAIVQELKKEGKLTKA
ncbi:MAG: transcription antitermination factor NusB [Bacteroidales bacterium 45-6]|nr:MAG: transcription antitermination factor NusB [Bacteroidales bacterium 45-6]